jgi:dTDP-4-amino-4,6-dideoxygalactose transaminase
VIPLAGPVLGALEKEAVLRVLESGMIAQGPEVAAFEQEFAATVEGRHCIAVNSGTSALHLGLLAAGIGKGDEVIVPSFTFAATANAVVLAGATPVFVDIEPATYCMSSDAAAAAVGPRTTAIMPVHLYGHPAEMARIGDLARRHGLAVFEDAAQAHLAECSGVPVGCHGSFGAFSFYPTKNMTTGEGGMVVTADEAVARKVRLLRNQGMEIRYQNELVGFNARMTDIAAAIGRVQLEQLPTWTEARRCNAAVLDEGLEGVVVPACVGDVRHVYHQYTVRSTDRESLVGRLEAAGVGHGIYYENPVHRLPSFRQTVDLPETERAAASVVSLPVHPKLAPVDLERIVEAVNG